MSVSLQSMKVGPLRKKYIAMVKASAAPQASKAAVLAQIPNMTRETMIEHLKAVSNKVGVQAKKQTAKSQKRRSSKSAKTQTQSAKARRTSNKSAKGGRKTASGARRNIKIPKELRARAEKIVRAIKAGRIAVKQQKSSPSKYQLADARDRYTAFVNLYKDVRITRKSNKSSKSAKKHSKKTHKSAKRAFAQIQGQKYPYYLAKGYRIPAKVVGGGARGAGVIRAVPGSKAPPFNSLSADMQARVIAMLNSASGLKLRGKGAPKTVSAQAIKKQAVAQKQRRKSLKSRSHKSAKRQSAKGAANRR